MGNLPISGEKALDLWTGIFRNGAFVEVVPGLGSTRQGRRWGDGVKPGFKGAPPRCCLGISCGHLRTQPLTATALLVRHTVAECRVSQQWRRRRRQWPVREGKKKY